MKNLTFKDQVDATMGSLKDILIEKNKRYGNSALEPIRILSKSSNIEQLLVRCDDKLKRIENSAELRKNDVADLINYLILVCIAKEWTNFSEFLD
jgi:hypothetical protein